MLKVATGQLGHPMIFVILMKARNRLFHNAYLSGQLLFEQTSTAPLFSQ